MISLHVSSACEVFSFLRLFHSAIRWFVGVSRWPRGNLVFLFPEWGTLRPPLPFGPARPASSTFRWVSDYFPFSSAIFGSCLGLSGSSGLFPDVSSLILSRKWWRRTVWWSSPRAPAPSVKWPKTSSTRSAPTTKWSNWTSTTTAGGCRRPWLTWPAPGRYELCVSKLCRSKQRFHKITAQSLDADDVTSCPPVSAGSQGLRQRKLHRRRFRHQTAPPGREAAAADRAVRPLLCGQRRRLGRRRQMTNRSFSVSAVYLFNTVLKSRPEPLGYSWGVH